MRQRDPRPARPVVRLPCVSPGVGIVCACVPSGLTGVAALTGQGTYSYCHLTVFNATHLAMDSYAVEEQIVEDSFVLVQHNHGMRV